MAVNKHKRCPVIGLAGGIGSGKSAVAAVFERLGARVINADKIAHEVLDSPEVRERIAGEFGPEALSADGRVNRGILAQKAFTSKERVVTLNSIIHPAVIDQTKRIIESARRDGRCPAVALDAPLIIEAGLDSLCDAIVFVETSESARMERLRSSRGWTPDEMARREKFQESLIYKRQRADYIVDNNGSPEDAALQAAVIWEKVVGPGSSP